MRVAFLTTVLPAARRTGGEVASQAVIDAIRRAGHDVRVVGYARPGADPGVGEVSVSERTIETERAGVVERLGWATTATLGGLPLSAAKYAGATYARLAREAASESDVLIVDRAQAGWWIRSTDVLPPIVLLVQNVEAGVYADQHAAARGPRRVLLRRERKLVTALEDRLAERAAEIWAYTEEERAHFDARLLPLPGTTTPPDTGRIVSMDVALLGTWSWEPNAVGLRWFADDVLPRLATRDVHVAGGGADWIADRGATYHGIVPDAGAYLDSARVVAIPSTTGRGIQIKTLDALALGAWVVATDVARRGLEVDAPAIRVTDDAAAFAAAVDELVADPRTLARCDAALAWSAPRRAALDATVKARLEALVRV